MTEELPKMTDADIELIAVNTRGIRLKAERGHLTMKNCTCHYGRTDPKQAVTYKRDRNCPVHG